MPAAGQSPLAAYGNKPVEFWPTAAIQQAVESGDLAVWQRIVVALKRDPFGRTARQVEEVLENTPSPGIAKALNEVLIRSRAQLQADECAEVARQIHGLIDRSGLAAREFASRIGVTGDELAAFLAGDVSPSAAQMVRMRRLSDRFAKMKAQRTTRQD
ncbi:MAG: XRE family transcriptional regulator [Mycobacteriaceae bacterium]|nr:XRE family transcriptional regulator [Mycobacteriaceae bacterium]